MQHNPKDPLLNVPPTVNELWKKIGELCNGQTTDTVLLIGYNMVINAIRQDAKTQKKALDYYDDVATQARERLAEHFATNGVRRNIFPFTQHLNAELADFSKDRKW